MRIGEFWARVTPQRAFRLTILAAALMIAAALTAVFGAVWQSRSDALAMAKNGASDLASLLAEQVSNSTQGVDLVLDDVKRRAEQLGSGSGTSNASMSEFLEGRLARLPQADVIAIFDRHGRVVSTSRTNTLPTSSFAERDYFRHHAERRSSELFVSKPVISLVTGHWTTYFSRRLETPSGEFLGIAMVGVRPEALMQLQGQGASLASNAFLLMRRDGTVLARFPEPLRETGFRIPRGSAWYGVVDQGGGTYRSPGIFAGVPRIVAVRVLEKYPFVINVAPSEAAALTTWQKRAMQIAWGAAFAVLCFISLMWALAVQLRNLRRNNMRFDAALSNMSQGLAMYDASGRLVICNQRLKEMYGLTYVQVRAGSTLEDVKASMVSNGFYFGDSPDEFLGNALAFGKLHTVKLNDGRAISIKRNSTEDGGWVTTHMDVTEQTRAIDRVTHMALHDSLTGLGNRVRFSECLDAALISARRSGREVAVLYLDLDRFKDVNDTLGHGTGDLLLQQVAERIRRCVGSTETVARLGGDEFAIVVENATAANDAADLATRLLDSVGRVYVIDGNMMQVTTSIGIATFPADGSETETLSKHADLALYRAKADGKAAFRYFERSMSEAAHVRHELERELRQAIEERQFVLHYQPIVRLSDRRIIGFEALVRWQHPTRGLVAPSEFIPCAEEAGLIIPIGEWVLQAACAEAALWPDDIQLAVNISSVQIRSCGLVQTVRSALDGSRLSAHRLDLEITESILLNNSDANMAVLMQLRQLGIALSMDDFGTGYSSLSYLRQFPFDNVKIDRSFVSGVCEGEGGEALVRAIVGISDSLGMNTVAEGVESEEQSTALRALGCTLAQGYYFSPPRMAQDLPRLLNTFNGTRTAA